MASGAGDGPPGLADQRPAWCTYKSLLDILKPGEDLTCRVTSVAHPPLSPPIGQFLEEAYMCIRNGAGDPHLTAADPASPLSISRAVSGNADQTSPMSSPMAISRALSGNADQTSPRSFLSAKESGPSTPPGMDTSSVDNVSPTWRVARLLDLIRGENGLAAKVGSSLFWIAVSGIFGHIPVVVVDEFKDDLAASWYNLTLLAFRLMPHEPDARDWVLSAMPIVYAQAFFRVLLDAFEDDKKQFTGNATQLVEKLTLVCHFEITGFQMKADTARKIRRKLLVKTVLQKPDLNRLEFLRGKKRQQKLESEKLTDSLSFGQLEGARVIGEESQLEHLIQSLQIEKKDKVFAQIEENNRKAGAAADEPVAEHMNDHQRLHADLPRTKPYKPSDGVGGAEKYEDFASDGAALFDSQMAVIVATAGGADEKTPLGGEMEETDNPINLLESEPASPGLSPPQSPTWGASRLTTWDGEDMSPQSADQESASPKTPGASRWNKLRLAHRANKNMASEVNVKSRQERELKARRIAQEALHNKVANDPLPPELCERQIGTDWVSPITKRMCVGEKDRCVLHKSASESFLVKMNANSFPMMPLVSTLRIKKTLYVQKDDDVGSDATSAPAKDTDDKKDRKGERKKSMAPGVPLRMDPPESLKNKVILQRLDTQADAFRKTTFGVYTKDHDVFTGEFKVRLNEQTLKMEERSFLGKMHDLVGGPPKKLVPLSRTAKPSST